MRLKLVLFLHPHIRLPSSHPFADQEGSAVFVYGCIVRPETLSSGLASAELTFSVPPSSPWSMKQGRRVSWPSTSTPAGPPPSPPFLHPASLFIPLATRPACSLPLAMPGSSSGLRSPSYKEKPGLPLPPNVNCAPPQILTCCPSLFPSLLVASSPLVCPGLLPGSHSSVLFVILLKK